MASIYKRIQRIDPSEELAKPDESDPTAAILTRLKSGVVQLGRRDHYCQTPSPDSRQDRWERLRFAVIATQAMPHAEFLAGGKPMPFLEIVEQMAVQNFVVRFTSLLDDELASEIQKRSISVQRNNLNSRIDAVKHLISNSSELHDLRQLRNEISHVASPPNIDWTSVEDGADAIEVALSDLGVIHPAPRFTFTGPTLTHVDNDNRESELCRKHLTVGFFADGQPYADFVWPYVWILSSTWRDI